MLRARVESGIPKLLVKINPSEAEGCAAKNLGEVMLRKFADPISGVSAHRGHVAVLHMSYSVPPGELVMSLKLAEILDVEEDESVELTPASGAGASATTPAPASTAATGSQSDGLSGLGSSRRTTGAREAEATPLASGWLPKADAKFGAPWPTAASMEPPFGGKLPPRTASFDYDWLRGAGLESDGVDAAGWRQRNRDTFGASTVPPGSSPSSATRGLRVNGGGSPLGAGQEAGRGSLHFADLSGQRSPWSSTPTSAAGVAAAATANAATAASSAGAAPEWLRDLRAFAEYDVREANRTAVGSDLPDLSSGMPAGLSGSAFSGGMSEHLSGSPFGRDGATRGLRTGSLFGSSATAAGVGVGSSNLAPGHCQSWRSTTFGGSAPQSFSGVASSDLASGLGTSDRSHDLRSDTTALPRRATADAVPPRMDFEYMPSRADGSSGTRDNKATEGISSEFLGCDDQWPRWSFSAGWRDSSSSPFAAGLNSSLNSEHKTHLGAAGDPLAEPSTAEPLLDPPCSRSTAPPGDARTASFDYFSRSGGHPLPRRNSADDPSKFIGRSLGRESGRRSSDGAVSASEWQSRTFAVPNEKVDSLPASDSSDESAKVLGFGKVRPGQTRLPGSTPDAATDAATKIPVDLGHADDFHLNRSACETRESKDLHNWTDDLSGLSSRHYATAPTSSVWDAPTPQRAGHSVTPAVAESLEPSPMHSRAMSRTSSPSVPSRGEAASSRASSEIAPPALPSQEAKRSVRIASRTLSEASSRAPSSPASSPRERSVHASSSPLTSSPRGSSNTSDQAQVRHAAQRAAMIVPHTESSGSGKASGPRRQSGLLSRRKSRSFGFLETEEKPGAVPCVCKEREARRPVSSDWRPPADTSGIGLERSELGSEVTVEIRQWLLAETSGPQCSQVVLDRALTVLANFKLASGCQLEVLGGPLGAIVGGYSDADWLHDEVFRKQPSDAIREAFMLLGFRGRADGDWSNIAAEEVSLAYRRLCLRGHPSRGGDPRGYLKLQVAMELIRAFAGDAGPLDVRTPRAKEQTPKSTRSSADDTPTAKPKRGSSKESLDAGFILNDVTLVRELQLTAAQAEEEAREIPQETLEEMNRALDEYILRQMCFKSEIVDEIARLHEDCAYAILGVDSNATDSEIKKAYRLIAMQCHPDKGGDKEDFQELNNAYEKIMEQRRSTTDSGTKSATQEEDNDDPNDDEDLTSSSKKNNAEADKGAKAEKDAEEAQTAEDEGDAESDKNDENAAGDGEDEYGEEGSNASLVDKASKAAEEASRYAKTAAEFAHQAAEAAETARRGREQGSRDTLTKSIAHSAIVLTLTVVKAVRVVGYATLDVAAQCRIAAKRIPAAVGCSERAVSAMSLGLEALNAALACAEVTETTAAELQAPVSASEGDSAVSASGATAAAERFVGAAVRASLAAASASNAAMSAAIAAVEGSRECNKAVESQATTGAGNAEEDDESRSAEATSSEARPEDAALRAKLETLSAGELKERAREAGATPEELDELEEGEDPIAAMIDLIMKYKSDQASAAERQERKQLPPPPTPEEAALAATKRLVAQRNNNHKVLQRLNAEILGHQQNVKQFLQANRQLIPEVSGEAKKKVFSLLQDYATEARGELDELLMNSSDSRWEELLQAITEQPMLAPFAQEQAVAIPVSVKARVLKMAALYDLELTMKVLDSEIFVPVRTALQGNHDARQKTDKILTRIQEELRSHMREAE